jgi:hypothetical protein
MKYLLPTPQLKRVKATEEAPEAKTERCSDPRIARPKTLEDMSLDEIEEIMRRRNAGSFEWGRNEFGEPRPLSAWDNV